MNTLTTLSASARLRAAAPTDEAFLRALFADARPDAEKALYQSPMGSMLLKMQFEARQRAYTERFPEAEDRLVIGDSDEPVGRLLVSKSGNRFHLIDIALTSPARGQGLGTALLQQLQQEAEVAGLPVRLTVAAGSPAKRLYERLGFQTTHTTQTDTEMEWMPLIPKQAVS